MTILQTRASSEKLTYVFQLIWDLIVLMNGTVTTDTDLRQVTHNPSEIALVLTLFNNWSPSKEATFKEWTFNLRIQTFVASSRKIPESTDITILCVSFVYFWSRVQVLRKILSHQNIVVPQWHLHTCWRLLRSSCFQNWKSKQRSRQYLQTNDAERQRSFRDKLENICKEREKNIICQK